jgi:uncharacterized protein YjbI with pentapeptide repeats
MLFGGELCDGKLILGAKYSNSTFANISFLQAKLRHGTFRNCVFVECYFRRTDIRNSSFIGCKFINCNFGHVIIRDCDFRYAEFRGTAPAFSEITHSAPQQANLKHELFDALSRASEDMGNRIDARRYRLAGIEALNKHLSAAVRAESTWYAEHFDVLGRIGAALTLLWHRFNRLLWGHGESAWRLLTSAALAVLAIFPVLFLIFRSGLEVEGAEPKGADFIWLSTSNFLLLDRLSDVTLTSGPTHTVAAVEAIAGVVFAGMFVTLLIRALLRR